jgi:uncharacterized alkaline shock family protein YloU
MTDIPTGGARHAQPLPIDLTGIDTARTDTPDQLLSTTVAETTMAVTGVHHLGGRASRALDRASRRVLGTSTIPGVTVSHDDGLTTIDLDLVVEYPHTITTVIDAVRTQVVQAAGQLGSGLVEVNVEITDVHGPFDTVVVDEPLDPSESLLGQTRKLADEAQAQTADIAESVRAGARRSVDAAQVVAADAAVTADRLATAAANTATDMIDAARDGLAETADAAADAAANAKADEPNVTASASPAVIVIPVVTDFDPDFDTAGATDVSADSSSASATTTAEPRS